MYKATLKKGKTYHVGGVTFKVGAPLVVSKEIGEYLKTTGVFDVEEIAYNEEPIEELHAMDLMKEIAGEARPNAPVAEAGPVPPPDIVGTHAPGIVQTTNDQDYQPIMSGDLQANTQPEISKGVIIDGEGSIGLQRSEEHNVGGARGGALRDSRRPRKHKGGDQRAHNEV
ncbi:MAG: hypothetical protein HPY71_13550 [Firmicutes bacterium]|nr:hypothetical protein [Bacillota bacterium]